MRRIPMLSGPRIVLVPARDGDVLIRPPHPPEQVVDTDAAVRDALRFPLSGEALDSIAPPGGRATIVVEPRGLPVPGAQLDPRADALAATIDELERCGIPGSRHTILVAGGLGQRLGQRELERLLPPPRARAFRGQVLVHDAEDPTLVPIGDWKGSTVRINPAVSDTDLVLVVGAAETVLHGGPGALLAACDAVTVRRAAGGDSLVEASGAPEWTVALEVERAIAERASVMGVSLVLDLPRLTGPFRGYPDEREALDRVARSPLLVGLSLLPPGARFDVLTRQSRTLATSAAFAGPPSVAHAEALLRGVELRGVRLAEPFDALVAGVSWTGPHVPRERLNPITVAALTLGLALRLRRDAFPVAPNGTLILLHALTRSFHGAAQRPYAAMFHALRSTQDGTELAEAERVAAVDEQSIVEYRAGKTCHPLLPYADWAGCAPALRSLGRVLVAGSRDASTARALGFVPTRSVSTALEMVEGLSGADARVGLLLTPPYAPLIVG